MVSSEPNSTPQRRCQPRRPSLVEARRRFAPEGSPPLARRVRTPQDGRFRIQELPMSRPPLSLVSLLALALVVAPAEAAQAQPTVGSGVAASEVGNSVERPLEFAASALAEGALVIVVQSAILPDSLPLADEEREGIARAIAAADFEGKAGDTLSLRGVGSRPRLLLVGVGETPTPVDFAEAAGKAAQELKGEKAPIAIV